MKLSVTSNDCRPSSTVILACYAPTPDSRSTNLVDQKMLYVALSRARAEAIVVTDDKDRLVHAIYERAGEKQTAVAASVPDAGKAKTMAAGIG